MRDSAVNESSLTGQSFHRLDAYQLSQTRGALDDVSALYRGKNALLK
jgi:hypothetical protein